MGVRGGYPVKHVGPGRKTIYGSFTTVNDADPSGVTGRGYTVARTGEGIWTVTLADTPNKIDSVLAWCEIKTETDVCICQGDIDNKSNSTFRIQLWVAPDPTTPVFALADEPGSVINFAVVVRDTNVSDPS